MENVTLDKVKHLELKILKYVDEICSKNNIKYYLIGGTLLGAIRHRGFIPWDDDIDIVMFREDYNKFIELTNNRSDVYFIQNFMTDSSYTRYITKIRLNGTSFVEKGVKDLSMHHGIFIDIFPLDKIIPHNEKQIENQIKLAQKFIRLQQIKAGKVKGRGNLRTKRNKLVQLLLKIIPSKMIGKIIDRIYGMQNNKPTQYVTNFSSQYGWRKQTFPIDVYGEGTYLEFEGHQFMAPAKWEVILKSLYGDYMKLPPEEKRNSGHDVVHIDLGKYAEN
jgi:lipopolysaccharide cholinephosphotransferase